MRSPELFLNFLVRRGVLTSKRCAEISSIIAKQGGNIVEILVRGGFVDSDILARQEAEFFNLEYCQLKKKILEETLSVLPFNLARDCGAICFFSENQYVRVGLVYPETENLVKLRQWAKDRGLNIEYYICSLTDYEKQLQGYLVEKTVQPPKKVEVVEPQETNWNEMPIDKVVNIILAGALKERAREILINKNKEFIQIRLRVGENLLPAAQLASDIYPVLINYLKGLAHLPPTIKDQFIQGKFNLVLGDQEREFELRVIFDAKGEVVSIKPKDRQQQWADFEQLGFNKQVQKVIEGVLGGDFRKVVVIGDAGSGKTATLRAFVQTLRPESHAVLVEKYPEGDMPNITRIQVKPEIGLSYAKILPEILRWQPDYLIVDEVNNAEVAAHLLHSSLSGIGTLTSVRGTSVLEGVKELLNLNFDQTHLAAVLDLLLAQKLVRRVCSHCSESTAVPNNLSRKVLNILAAVPQEYWPRGLDYNASIIYAPKSSGCSWCNYSGFNGKVALHECLPVEDRLRYELSGIGNDKELAQLIEQHLAMNMLQDGLLKALRGLTTVEEVFSNCEQYNII